MQIRKINVCSNRMWQLCLILNFVSLNALLDIVTDTHFEHLVPPQK